MGSGAEGWGGGGAGRGYKRVGGAAGVCASGGCGAAREAAAGVRPARAAASRRSHSSGGAGRRPAGTHVARCEHHLGVDERAAAEGRVDIIVQPQRGHVAVPAERHKAQPGHRDLARMQPLHKRGTCGGGRAGCGPGGGGPTGAGSGERMGHVSNSSVHRGGSGAPANGGRLAICDGGACHAACGPAFQGRTHRKCQPGGKGNAAAGANQASGCQLT